MTSGRSFSLIELMIVVVILALLVGVVVPNLVESRRNSNEAAAIGTLKTIGASQSLFREWDHDADGLLTYGSLAELSSERLIDSVLSGGTRQGYTFATEPSSTTAEFLWWATANPSRPGLAGSRFFATNHEGVTYYTTTHPFAPNPATCAIVPPTGAPGPRSLGE